MLRSLLLLSVTYICETYLLQKKKPSGTVYLCLIEIVQVVDTDQLGRVRAARSCHLKHNFSKINKIHFLLSFAPQT